MVAPGATVHIAISVTSLPDSPPGVFPFRYTVTDHANAALTATAQAVYVALRAGRFRPAALRVSALRFTGGLPGTTMRGLERSRRVLRGPVRRLERAVRR